MDKLIKIIIISLQILLAGCQPSNSEDLINGVVYDGTTMEPLNNADFYLFTRDNSFKLSDTIEATTTNETGEFDFMEIFHSSLQYVASAQTLNYFSSSTDVLVTNGQPNAFIYLDPQAVLKLHIKNELPVYFSEYIHIRISNLVENKEVFDFTVLPDSIATDTTIYALIFGNRYNSLTWDGESNSDYISKGTSLFCNAFDTIEYEIAY